QNVASKKVIEQLEKMNVEVKNHMSTITVETSQKLDEVFNPKEKKKAEAPKQGKQVKQEKPSASNKSTSGSANKPKKPQKQQQQRPNKKKKGKAKGKGRHQKQQTDVQQAPVKEVPKTPEHIVYSGTLTVDELAQKLNKEVS